MHVCLTLTLGGELTGILGSVSWCTITRKFSWESIRSGIDVGMIVSMSAACLAIIVLIIATVRTVFFKQDDLAQVVGAVPSFFSLGHISEVR